jgi:hypothetical protein
MKKIFILLSLLTFSFATIDYTVYEKKVDKMANYSLNIDYNKIYNPFFIPKTLNKLELNNSKVKVNPNIVKLKAIKAKSIKPVIKVLAKLNKKILLEVKTDKIYKKWLRIGEVFKKVKFLKIDIDNDIIYLKIDNTIKKIKLNKKKLKVKVF